jgi:anti-sigma factor ChrR (cupin superfamily)
VTAKWDSIENDAGLSATLIAQLAAGLELQPLSTSQRAALKQRILHSIAAPQASGSVVVKAASGDWVHLFAGVSIKALRIDTEQRTHTSLWRLEPGAVLPEHDHYAEEECLVVAGSVDWSGATYVEGDYLLARPGFRHSEMRSTNGATLLLRGELTRSLEQAFAMQST